MKIFKISMMALLLSSTFIACKKESAETVLPKVETTTTDNSKNILQGIWEGEYVTTTRTAPVFLAFNIKPGGVLDLLNESHQVIGSGTWTYEGLVFKATYIVATTNLTYSIKGELTTSPEKLNGAWQYDQPYEDTGFWFMDKVG